MITIDARWIRTSGIGTYLRHLIPVIVDRFSDCRITLLGSSDRLRELLRCSAGRYSIIESNAAMYSIREQIDYARLIPRDTTLYFATHYNVPLFYSGRMLVTVYDTMHLAMPQFACGYHKQLYAKFMFAAVRRKAESILTISEFTKKEMKRLVGEFEQPITPIHLGVGEKWFSIPQVPSPHLKPYLLYVGNIKPHKNLTVLIKAFISLADRIHHDLVLVGKKEGFITGDREVSALAQYLPERIHFTGLVSDELLHQYYRNAEAFVFPSLYEGFGLPPLEAMAARCPVVVSDAGSLPEVCGDAAVYFDPYDENDLAAKLLKITNDDELRVSLRKRGYERAQSLTWDRCVDQTCDVIEKLLDAPARGF